MQRPATQSPTTTQSDSASTRSTTDVLHRTSPPSAMAATTLPSYHQTLSQIDFRDQRPTLPPLANLEYVADRAATSPLTTPPISRVFGHLDPFQRLPQPSPTPRSAGFEPRYQQHSPSIGQAPVELRDPFLPIQYQGSVPEPLENPLKRPFGALAQPPPRQPYAPQTSLPSAHLESRGSHSTSGQTTFPSSSRSSYSDASTPSQTHSILSFMGQGSAQEARAICSNPSTNRLSLHIRQQPRAARAGPDGKDRRAIDPPPVLQLMIDDFDVENDDDINELRSSYFVVHCRLVSATAPKKDLSTTQTLNEDGTVEIQRLLLGTTVASPFFCRDDPHQSTMPTHPVTNAVERPPSPSSRFIQSRSQVKSKEKAPKPKTLPGSFFIFADLSVRKAGEYRLEFCLMKIEASSMQPGKILPVVHTVHSHVFRVVNAKDFDQVQPSTALVKGLLDRGAGFPLKLKKGIREGQRRRQTQGDSDDDDDDDDDEAS